MAYIEAWNEAAPIGATTPAADLDVEIQNLKVSIRERMDEIVGTGNWANDGVQPKVVQTQYFAGRSVVTKVLTASDVKLDNIGTSATSGDFTNNGDEIVITNTGEYAFTASLNVGTLDTNPVVLLNLQLIGSGTVAYNQVVWSPKSTGGLETVVTLMGVVTATAADVLSILAKNSNSPATSATVNSFYFTLIRLN
jgi:hypothetical protein